MSRLAEATKERRGMLDGLSGRQARAFLQEIHDLLWPVEDPTHEWSPDTLDRLADVMSRAADAGDVGQ